ncbi:hypothetical protein F442_18707 [Phytophthora nicotianae P10297]|uniref:Uncharacterized protein n=4 Tax=Phytophthora nicotianae TaxID=4792 RepID=W2QY37_PHYN3|nr:hypothetical protein PPTG_21629 [Phytophthora nicotianae INRA-310]ETI34603.1 hypothetical protein F443_18928 [Phytophthora nicotianae P1569]ETK74942.1 hypothetical protein L915_18359 [Phytophthora nicotianae]ETP32633.1 hypothetical protein F442_18707 [Phytophthora nicotianae P10297]ETM34823.1 hypothetical protein L914_18168 [Phytophthora nicotianae]ETN17185.1 hypothetical protein PPTG_21629 [Phytophthora nicotianae INRA-310]
MEADCTAVISYQVLAETTARNARRGRIHHGSQYGRVFIKVIA